MGRYLGSTAVEYAAYRYLITSIPDLNLYKHPRGWAAIELPNPDGTWEAHRIHSRHTYAWISNTYALFTQGLFVLTEAEVKRVAELLTWDALVTAPPPIPLPLDPQVQYEPLLELVVEFMLDLYQAEAKTSFDDSMTKLRAGLVASADRQGFPDSVIPAAPWLGRILPKLKDGLKNCGLRIRFYRKTIARHVVIDWHPQPKPPDLDGDHPDGSTNQGGSSRSKAAQGTPPNDGNDGKQHERDWDRPISREGATDEPKPT